MSMVRMIVVLACVALAACGPRQAQQAASAGGKVLPGSISDSMIDLNRSRAEAPLGGPAGHIAAGGNQAAAALLGGSQAEDQSGATGAPGLQEQPTPGPDSNASPKAGETPAPEVKPSPKPAAAATKPATPARPKQAVRKPADETGA